MPSSWLIRAQELHHGVGERGIEARHRLVGQDARAAPGRGRARWRRAAAGRPTACPRADPPGPPSPTRVRRGVRPRDVGGGEPADERPPAGRVREPPDEHVVQHAEAAQQVELLEHEADRAPGRAGAPRAEAPVTARAVHASPARGRGHEAIEAAQQASTSPLRSGRSGPRTRPGSTSRSTPSSARRRPGSPCGARGPGSPRGPAVKWKWRW